MRSILLLNHNRRGRGTWWRNFHLARELTRRGWRAMVWTVSPRRRWQARFQRGGPGLLVVETPWLLSRFLAGNGLDPADLWWRWRRARKMAQRRLANPLTVFASDHLPGVSLPAFCLRRCARLVADWADLFTGGGLREKYNRWPTRWLYRAEAWLEAALKRRADGCTAISPLLLERLKNDLGLPAERCLLLPNGCQAPATALPWTRAHARQQLGLPAQGLRIGVLASGGRLDAREVRELAALARRAAGSQAAPVFIDLIGPFSRRLTRRLQAHAGPEICVHCTGWTEPGALALRLAACDMGWAWDSPTPYHASRYPTRLAAWLEAGVPVVVSPVGYYSLALQEAGAAVRCHSVACPTSAEVVALERLLGSPTARETAEAAAQAWARGPGAWSVVAQGLAQWLEGLPRSGR